MKLIAPASYYKAKPETRAKICNGTGAAGSPKWLVWFLDSLFGLGINFNPASGPHDWGYHFCKHWWQKILVDIVYCLNMCWLSILAIFQLRLSRFIGNLFMFPLRLIRGLIYFIAVLFCGWKAFYNKQKNNSQT
jgi:hypothetical protein